MISRDQLNGSNFSYQLLPLSRCLDDLAALGLGTMELWATAPHLHIPAATPASIADLGRQLDARELTVSCLTPEQCLYPVNLASRESWLRESSLAMFRRAIEVASDLGCPHLLVTSGRGYEDEPREDAWGRARDALGELAQAAAAYGVTLLLEPLQRSESNLVLTYTDVTRMRREVGSAHLAVVLDTVAMVAAGDTVADYLGDAANAAEAGIRHVHLVDGHPTGHLAVGDGELPLGDIVRRLSKAGYAGRFTFELFGSAYLPDPLSALERSIERTLALR